MTENRIQQAETEFKRYLASQKLKYTPERRTVLQEILQSQEHFDADGLFSRLRGQKKRVSRATVYRTLDLLARLGLVRRIHLGDRTAVYERINAKSRHGHLVCLSCGKMKKFQIPSANELVVQTCDKHKFKQRDYSLEVVGFCRACSKKGFAEIK